MKLSSKMKRVELKILLLTMALIFAVFCAVFGSKWSAALVCFLLIVALLLGEE